MATIEKSSGNLCVVGGYEFQIPPGFDATEGRFRDFNPRYVTLDGSHRLV